ncbi:MAG: sugar ABC transporter substrate-binding protein [Trueperaceae bacterium]|nr:sugar ABC transporter substrate-binding protein [Trueperaceae bacterium]
MKKINRRQFLKRTAVGALGFTTVGVIRSPFQTQFYSLAQGEAVDLTLMMVDYSDPVKTALEEVIIPMFVEENPGSTVTVNYSDWARYNEEMTTAFAAGVTPDVFQGGAVWSPQMARRGWAYPLTDLIAADADWNWDDFPPGIQSDVTVNGEIVGVPYRQDLRTLWYRKDMLEAAGFSAPPTNWDEFLEVAKATTVKNGDQFEVEGYHLSHVSDGWQRDWQPYLIWLEQAGGQFLSDDLTKCMLDQEPALNALQFLHDLIHVHKVTSYPGLEPQGDLQVIVAGDAAMQFGNADFERIINLYAPDQAGLVLPTLPLTGAIQATHAWVNKFFVSSQSKNPERAWDLLRFLTRADVLEIYSAANNNTPPRQSLLEAPYMSELHRQVLAAAPYAQTFPQHPNLIGLFRPVTEELEKALTGTKDPEKALQDATKQVNLILEDG